MLRQMIMIYAISQIAMKFFLPQKPQTSEGTTDTPSYEQNSQVNSPVGVNPWLLDPQFVNPTWPLGSMVDVHVYLSQSFGYDMFSESERKANRKLPSVVWKNLTLGDWSWSRAASYTVDVPEAVQRNGSLIAHVYLTKDGYSPDPNNAHYDPAFVTHTMKPLSRYQPQITARKEKSLLTGTPEEKPEEEETIPDNLITSYWHPNLTLAIVSDSQKLAFAKLPPTVRKFVTLVPGMRDTTGTQGLYYPILFPNDFWILKNQQQAINTTTPTLPLTITLDPMSFMKFQLYASMTQGFEDAAKQQGGAATAELDEVKRMLIETNPYFLGLTGIVSVLHMVFEMLAFKNDVQHWRSKKEMTGVSIRTIITNVVVQLIILLYLIDNNDNTSWMILFGQGMGMVIEAWKITKAVDISVVPSAPGSTLPYRVSIKDKHELSEDEKQTKVFDALAFRYVSYVAIPLLIGYSIYSLVYETHRGWYSFVISTATSFVYMFGFAQLVPQLIINYKLKSVSHMPFKAMIYKTLSTVVDDFFAFCIKMPLMHRLACFRDDVVFLIFIYQRYIYRVDHNRVNEYGQVSELAKDKEGESKKTK